MFSILGGFYFFGVFFFRNKLSFKSKKLKEKKQELAPIISNFLFHDLSSPISEQKEYVELKIRIRNDIKNPAFRKILTEILIDLQKDVAGATRHRLNELYFDLNLHLDAYHKLKSWRWHVVSKGILELTQMKVDDSYQFITKFINDKRSPIRKQAEIATVSLRSEGIAHFLDTTRYSISEWQQLKLMEALKNIEQFCPPSFKTWLISTNRDVVLFSLRLIKFYNQNDAISSLIQLLKHKDDRIKNEAIGCIKEFCAIKALPTLKAIYRKTSENVKIEILDAIATLGSESDIGFLQNIMHNEHSFIIKNKAAMAINDILPDSVLPTKDIVSEHNLSYDPDEISVFGDEKELSKAVSNLALFDADAEEVPDTIMANEIEVFEVDVETVSLPEEKVDSKDKSIEPQVQPTFEIGPLSKELDESLNSTIGLVSDFQEEEKANIIQNKDFEKAYSEMENNEKEKFVVAMQDTASHEDIPLLEDIMEEESDSEFRFKIFEIIKKLDKKSEKPTYKKESNHVEVDEEPVKYQGLPTDSVFYELLDYATDLESKCILLENMAELGDEKELPLLLMLSENKSEVIRKKAEETKSAILSKLKKEQTEKPLSADSCTDANLDQTNSKENEKVSDLMEEKGLLPLELCFLNNDSECTRTEEEHLTIDFEFTEEFYQKQKHRMSLKE